MPNEFQEANLLQQDALENSYNPTVVGEIFFNRCHVIVSKVSYKDWSFHISRIDNTHNYLQVYFVDIDITSKEKVLQKSRKWILTTHMTDSEIIQTAFLAILTAEEHEAREKFLYDGVAVLGPHFNLVDITAMMKAKVFAVDVRPLGKPPALEQSY